jgi:hypothetical protein
MSFRRRTIASSAVVEDAFGAPPQKAAGEGWPVIETEIAVARAAAAARGQRGSP